MAGSDRYPVQKWLHGDPCSPYHPLIISYCGFSKQSKIPSRRICLCYIVLRCQPGRHLDLSLELLCICLLALFAVLTPRRPGRTGSLDDDILSFLWQCAERSGLSAGWRSRLITPRFFHLSLYLGTAFRMSADVASRRPATFPLFHVQHAHDWSTSHLSSIPAALFGRRTPDVRVHVYAHQCLLICYL